jgi:hypothetical protein
VLAALPEALSSFPAPTWWLTAICNEVWCPLPTCRHTCKQNTVYIINIKKKKKERKEPCLIIPTHSPPKKTDKTTTTTQNFLKFELGKV